MEKNRPVLNSSRHDYQLMHPSDVPLNPLCLYLCLYLSLCLCLSNSLSQALELSLSLTYTQHIHLGLGLGLGYIGKGLVYWCIDQQSQNLPKHLWENVVRSRKGQSHLRKKKRWCRKWSLKRSSDRCFLQNGRQ
jgi:hypothetical protein